MTAVTREVLDAIRDKRIPQADTELFATFRPWKRTDAEIAAGVTPVNYAYPPYELGPRYGIIADGVTDQTSAMLAVCNAIGEGTFIIPYNVLYNRETLLTSLDTNVSILDLSQINNLNSPGETAKRMGIISSDEAVSDTMWSIDSGHHAVLSLNNHGTSGTASGDKRLATVVWSAGQYANTTVAKRGDRGAAQLQFGKDGGGNYWSCRIVSFAPWNAIADTYELWQTGEVISGAGIYRMSSTNRHYVSTGAGTTGATEPSHSSGTVSDGGVSWTYVDDRDRGVWLVDEYGRVLIGNGAAGRTYYHKVAPTDPAGGAFTAEFEASGVTKTSDLLLTPTGGAGTAVRQPYLRAQDAFGLRLLDSSSNEIGRLSDSLGLVTGWGGELWSAVSNGDTTPSVLRKRVLYTVNSGATSITTLDDGVDGQEVTIVATDANTTLVHSVTLMLTGSANQLLTAWSSVTFKKVPNAISNRWIEVARSLK